MELWDAYDRNLEKIEGMTLIRGEKIPEGVYHLVCDVIVRHTDGEYLLMQRDRRKHYGGMWEATAGGSALQGENPLDCAIRELREETGIHTERLEEVGRVWAAGRNTVYCEFLCITDCRKDSIILQEGETSAYQWVTQDELLSISRRSGKIIFSHETALFLHGISDRTPFEHTVTAPSGCIPSAAIKAECKVYYIKPELFELGKTMVQTPAGNPVPCYDLERTICDVIRSRNKIGTETFLSALKQYAASPKKDLNRLDEYARQMRVSGVLRQYLEVLL